MKRKMIRRAVCSGLVIAMAATTVGCGFGSGSKKSKLDPALAKEGVFKYKEIDLGFSEDVYTSIISAGQANGNAQILVRAYDYSGCDGEATYFITVDDNGNVINKSILTNPDCSEYQEITPNDNYGGDDFTYYTDGVGDLGNFDDASSEAVLTAGFSGLITVENEDGSVDVAPAEPTDAPVYDPGYTEDWDYGYSDCYGGVYENFNLSSVQISENGSVIGMIEYYCSGYDDDCNYIEGNAYLLCNWDANGNIVWQTDLCEQVEGEWLYSYGSAILGDGSFFMMLGGEKPVALTFDSNGKVVNKKGASDLQILDSVSNVFASKDGRLIVVYYDTEQDYEIKCAYMDPATITLKEQISLPDVAVNMGYGSLVNGADTDFVCSTSFGLAKFNAGDADVKYFMDFVNSDLDATGLDNVNMIDEEHFIASYYDTIDYSTHVAYFTHVDPEDIPDKELINVAVYYLGYQERSMVVDFNKTNDKYRLVVTNYSQYSTDDDYYAGYKKMNNDIISGNCPDILLAGGSYVNYSAYANKGMLVDFDDLFAKDEELKDNEYLENVFDAYAVNGKHYVGVYSFNISTYMGSSRYFGNADSWTIEEFKRMQSQFPSDHQLYNYVTQDEFIYSVMRFDGSEFVDVESGKCDFDSEDFITLLEYAAKLPAEYDWNEDMYYEQESNKYRSGQIILYNTYVYDPVWFQQSRYEYFDGDTACVGFPSRTGDSSALSASGTPMVIFKKGNVDGAWEFARQFFTKEFQDDLEYDIPVLKSAFDDWAAKGMERPSYEYEGEIEYWDNYYYVDGVEHVVPVMTEDEVKEFKKMITSCHKVEYYRSEIMEIIEEEASACFAGQKTASEVAKIIQSRVQLYINENQ